MSRNIPTHIGENGVFLGLLRHDKQGRRERASFEYGETWLADRNRFALGPDLPLVGGPQFHAKTGDGSVFHHAIADTEPDGWAKRVIDRDHAKRRQEARRTGQPIEARELNDLDYLLMVDDISRVGALRFRDENGRYQRATEDGRRTTPPLIELSDLLAASRAVEANTETAADLAYLRGRGTSLGGMRPKCSVIDDNGYLSIGKFPSIRDERPVTEGEVLAMNLAALAGIEAARAGLVHSDGIPVALIRRFDREGDRRLMYVSAATMLGADPADAGEHTYTEIVDALRQNGSQAQADIEQLWRRIAFSVLITNVDDHLMNHGFLHEHHGQWRLSPAFDINPFPDRVRELKTWISEDTGPEASLDALMSVRSYFRVSAERAMTIIAEVEAAVGQWRTEGQRLGLSSRDLDSFADAFEHRERLVARRLSA